MSILGPSHYAYRLHLSRPRELGQRTWTDKRTIPLASWHRLMCLRAYLKTLAPVERWKDVAIYRIPLGEPGDWERIYMSWPPWHSKECVVTVYDYAEDECDCA